MVVDDGSSDDSRQVIESYGDQIVAVFQPNGGQGAAVNAGFRACKGEWIIFLDADDKLMPDAARRVINEASVATSCVQYYLQVIDENSKETGVILPTRPMYGGDLRQTVAQFRYYTSPPSSGNAYSRNFLEKVLPMPAEKWRISADAYLILAAPFYGFITALGSPAAYYRRHGGGASDSGGTGYKALCSYVKKEFKKEITREIYVRNVLNYHRYPHQAQSLASPTYCKYWILDTELQHRKSDIHQRIEIISRVLVCATKWPNYTFRHRMAFACWCLLVMALPVRLIVPFAGMTMLPHWRAKSKLNRLWQQKV